MIKTLDEVQKYVPVANSLSLPGLKPEITDVEDNVVVKHIGADFYNEIEAAYNGGSPTQAQQVVIDYLQETISNIAVGQYLDLVQVNITDSGVMRDEAGNEKPAYRYQKEQAKAHLLRRGWVVLENLLAYLEDNKASYPTWANGAGYTINKELIINSAEVFSKYYNIDNSRLLYQALQYIIKQVEDSELVTVIGEDLLTEIKNEILAGSVSSDNQKLLDSYIYPAVANLTIVRALGDMVVRLDENGAVVHEKKAVAASNVEESAADMERLNAKRFNVQAAGYRYLDLLRDYLNENASASLYAAYYNSSLYEAPVADDDSEEDESNIWF